MVIMGRVAAQEQTCGLPSASVRDGQELYARVSFLGPFYISTLIFPLLFFLHVLLMLYFSVLLCIFISCFNFETIQ